MTNGRLQFWYEFASNYSYLSAMRIDRLAQAAGVEISWKPFLLGPIFKAAGWHTSPFVIYPAKGRYMLRDMHRRASERGIPFSLPHPFPANGLLAARLALVACAGGWVAPFTRAVFAAEFGEGQNISDRAVLQQIIERLGFDSERAFQRAESTEIKQALKDQTALAQQIGIFGAPSFLAHDGELFWGDDRLFDALKWVQQISGDQGSPDGSHS